MTELLSAISGRGILQFSRISPRWGLIWISTVYVPGLSPFDLEHIRGCGINFALYKGFYSTLLSTLLYSTLLYSWKQQVTQWSLVSNFVKMQKGGKQSLLKMKLRSTDVCLKMPALGHQVHGLNTLYLMASILVVVIFTHLLLLHITYYMLYI